MVVRRWTVSTHDVIVEAGRVLARSLKVEVQYQGDPIKKILGDALDQHTIKFADFSSTTLVNQESLCVTFCCQCPEFVIRLARHKQKAEGSNGQRE